MAGTRTVTILVDDLAFRRGVAGEHGLSLLVETPHGRLLYDVGQSDLFLRNARAGRISLAGLDGVVLSHGHFDHTGGLAVLLDALGPIPVYAHPDALFPRAPTRDAGPPIGPPLAVDAYRQRGARFHFSRKHVTIGADFVASGHVPRAVGPGNEIPDISLVRDGVGEPDRIEDDQFLLVRGGEGWTVLTGCAHAGLANILAKAQALAAPDSLVALMGGFHLLGHEETDLEAVFDVIGSYELQSIVPLHCTGLRARVGLLERFQERVVLASTGDRISLP